MTQESREVLQKLRLIKEGKESPSQGLNFSGAKISGEDLKGVNLSSADFSGADLADVDFSGAQLFKSNFQGAVLTNVNFDRAELSGANFTDAIWNEVHAHHVGLGKACLKGARLFDSHLQDATLSLANLKGADLRGAHLKGARLREADLSEADFTSADMQGVDIALSNVDRATFRGANMQEANFRHAKGFERANWLGVDVRNVNFAGAYRLRRFIVDQNFLFEFRTSNRFNAFVYFIWWVTSDCGRSLMRWSGLIVIQIFLFASLYTFVEMDYGPHPTRLSPLYFSVVTLTTLGYGDVVPASLTAQVLSLFQVLTGYVMLGGLLVLLSDKIARRAD